MEKNVSIARLWCEKGKYVNALNVFAGQDKEEYIEQIATYLYALGDFPKCIKYAKTNLETFPDNEILQNRLLEANIAEEQYNEAIYISMNNTRFKRREEEVRLIQQHSEKFESLKQKEDYNGALREIEALLKYNIQSLRAREKKLDVLFLACNYRSVIDMIETEKLLETHKRIDFLYLKAISHYYLNEIKVQKELFSEIYKLDNNYHKCLEFRASNIRYEKRKEKANTLYIKREYEDAISVYESITQEFSKINPEELSELYYKMGVCCLSLEKDGFLENSIKNLDKSIQAYPKNYESLRKKAHVHLKMDDMQGAVECITKASEIAKFNIEVMRDSAIINDIFNLKKNEFEEKERRREQRQQRRKIREEKKQERINKKNDNNYTLIGLDPKNTNVEPREIRTAYLLKCSTEHPDLFSDTKEKERKDELFKKIQNAYNTLKNPYEKIRYDNTMDRYDGSDQEDNVSEEEKEEERVYSENLFDIYLYERKNKITRLY
jgi:hypothetical protein